MGFSWSSAANATTAGRLFLSGAALPLKEDVKILGVEVDQGLIAMSKTLTRKYSQRLSALRWVAGFLERNGKLLLYEPQIRPHLECAALSWIFCAATHRKRLTVSNAVLFG